MDLHYHVKGVWLSLEVISGLYAKQIIFKLIKKCFLIYIFVSSFQGLQEYDEILQFGSVNHQNFEDMSQINNIVAHSVGQRVNVKVKREHNVVSLTVVPRPWQQPGLLGCHIQRKA